MAFMICGRHLDREVHAAEDLSHPFQQGIGSYPQTPPNKGNGSSRAYKASTKTIFTTELATEEGTSSKKQKGNMDLSDRNIKEDRNN